MLKEFLARQIDGDYRRRWFADDYFDLYVWYEPDDSLHGFQLCYGKPSGESALTWTRDGGSRHSRIDSGESGPFSNLTPVLVPSTDFPVVEVLREFLARGEQLSDDVREMILFRISEFPVESPDSRPGN